MILPLRITDQPNTKHHTPLSNHTNEIYGQITLCFSTITLFHSKDSHQTLDDSMRGSASSNYKVIIIYVFSVFSAEENRSDKPKQNRK